MKKNFNSDELKKAVGSRDAASLLSSLSREEREMFDYLMKDKNARENLLGSKEAQELLRTLLGG